MIRQAARFVALAAGLAWAVPALAQDAAPAETTQATGPETYIGESFDDWTLRCVKGQDKPDTCEMVQALFDGDGNRVSEVRIIDQPAGSASVARMSIVVPLDTLLTRQITLQVDDDPAQHIPFLYCSVAGCHTVIDLGDTEIAVLKGGNVVKLTIVPLRSQAQPVTLNLSLKGFTAGYDAVSAQNSAE